MLKLLGRLLAIAAAAVVAGALFVATMALWSWWAPAPGGADPPAAGSTPTAPPAR